MIEQDVIVSQEHSLFADLCSEHIVCATSRRSQGNMSLSYGDTSYARMHRKDFLSSLGIGYRDIVCAQQVHGSRIAYITEDEKGSGGLMYASGVPATDALVTNRTNLALTIFSADCAVVFLYDARARAVGIVHAGWRGTKEHILAKTIFFMNRICNSRPSDIYLGFAPLIRQCCYRVGSEFRDFFPHDVTVRQGAYFCDLAGANIRQARDMGIRDIHIFDPTLCTSCQPADFFSYRQEGDSCGRMMSVIMLK